MTPEKQALPIVAWLWIRHGAAQSALLHRPGRVDGTYWKEKGYTTEPLCSHAAASSRIAELERALRVARECIALDRKCLFDCHENQRTGRVEDAAGLAGLAEYDEVLAVIDAAIGASTGGEEP